MRKSNPHTKNAQSNIQCLEVLIPRTFIANSSHNLYWTLSVYSLQNQPVRKNHAVRNSEIFHFMLYDWKRTIKQLLEDQQIPYSIIQYFSPETIYNDGAQNNSTKSVSELDSRSVLSEKVDQTVGNVFSNQSTLVLEEKSH